MSRTLVPKVRSLGLLSDSLQFDDVCELDHTPSKAPVVLPFGSLNRPHAASPEELVVESDTVSKQWEAGKGVHHCEWEANNWRTQKKHDDYGLHASLSKRRVAVTGAGGFIASWIVKLLLRRGFYVRGILRNIDDVNTSHLKCLEDANERLELRRADILQQSSLLGVLEGCEGVFHTACPVIPAVTDPEVQMLRPAVEGTLNVLRACNQARVQRIVLTSSIGAVYMNPNLPPEKVYDENCWRVDLQEWYCLAKLIAEKMAWEYAETHNLNLVTICPGITLGTMLQPRVNQSSTHILKYLNGSAKKFANLSQAYVDVEDAAEAHILAFEAPNASGRYICCKWSRHRGDIIDALTRMYPHYPIPTRCKDDGQPRKGPLCFCSKKVEQLGLQFTSLEQTLRRAVSSLQEKQALQKNGHPLF
ncbi:hypothetical protein KC19_VG072800 [Ceratodon purpureus]|uniref:NAD-dependent epimerase/dehydratase domain-containing protein n=1 Tax=Ceratodon purpureus TaxID=3225 RepID=A0A8T0HMP0_CERPU|nr:hypothetical protein KC19_VG072800 [Ceratodon purpureus]